MAAIGYHGLLVLKAIGACKLIDKDWEKVERTVGGTKALGKA